MFSTGRVMKIPLCKNIALSMWLENNSRLFDSHVHSVCLRKNGISYTNQTVVFPYSHIKMQQLL